MREYFDAYAEGLDNFRIKMTGDSPDDLVVQSIGEFIPYRNELIDFVIALGLYGDDNSRQLVNKLFENLIPYFYRPLGANSWNEIEFDNFKFIVHELFLYTIAAYLRYERFESIDSILSDQYLDRNNPNGMSLVSYHIFLWGLNSLEMRNKRLNLRRFSLHANLLKDRVGSTPVQFIHLMEADFLLYLRSILTKNRRWFPHTFVFIDSYRTHFESFTRMASASFFKKFSLALGCESKEQFIEAITQLEKTLSNCCKAHSHICVQVKS